MPLLRKLRTAARLVHQDVVDILHRPFRRRGPDPYHEVARRFNQTVNGWDRPRLLEIGSRNVTGQTYRQNFPAAGEYVGFDLHPGPGVDIAGDAHRLADHFPPNHFDAVIAISTFEHLLFPWKVALEINRVLRTGGLVLIATHPAWPAHELPWDFWRFPVGAFTAMFNAHTGFAIRDAAEGLPARGYSLAADRPTRGLRRHVLNQGVACVAAKVADYRADRLRWDIDAADVVDTTYPPPTAPYPITAGPRATTAADAH